MAHPGLVGESRNFLLAESVRKQVLRAHISSPSAQFTIVDYITGIRVILLLRTTQAFFARRKEADRQCNI